MAAWSIICWAPLVRYKELPRSSDGECL